MLENDTNKLLKEELFKYLYDKRFDISQIVDYIFETIDKSVGCDKMKFANVLSTLRALRKGESFSVAQNNIFDISTEENTVSVKEIVNDGDPILLFYNDGDGLPFLKIITSIQNEKKRISVESSNSPKLINGNKEKDEIPGFNYSFKDIYFCNKFGDAIIRRYVFAKADNEKQSETDNNLMLQKSENFYNFVSFVEHIASKYNDNPFKNLSEYKICLLEAFYDTISMVTSNRVEFSFDDLVKILYGLLIEEQGQSVDESYYLEKMSIAESAKSISERNGNEVVYNILTSTLDETPIAIKGFKSNKYLSLKISNLNDFEECNYIISETINGFTLFRSLDNSSIDKSKKSSFLLNLTEDTLKFSMIGGADTNLQEKTMPIDIELVFKENGSFVFHSENALELKKTNQSMISEKNMQK